MVIFYNVKEIMPCFFFQKWLKNLKLSNSKKKHHKQHIEEEKTVSVMVLNFSFLIFLNPL